VGAEAAHRLSGAPPMRMMVPGRYRPGAASVEAAAG
jgi:hypothetical protein